MESPEVPLERTQEDLHEHAEAAREGWIMGVALTAALLAVLAAITSLVAEHHADEALIDQIQSSDQWNYYQAKGIKANLLNTRIEILSTLGKTTDPKDLEKLNQYHDEQEAIRGQAEEKQEHSELHLRRHNVLASGVTMFQIAIAIGAISVLTKRKVFWLVSVLFGLVGAGFLVAGLVAGGAAGHPATEVSSMDSPQFKSTTTVFVSVYASNPCSPSSRPMPDILNPPKGAAVS